jgi:nicotinamide mononucleotide (NMN) deamidase PncC
VLKTNSVTYRNYDKKKWYTVYTHWNASSQAVVIQTASALAANISGARSHNTNVDI